MRILYCFFNKHGQLLVARFVMFPVIVKKENRKNLHIQLIYNNLKSFKLKCRNIGAN